MSSVVDLASVREQRQMDDMQGEQGDGYDFEAAARMAELRKQRNAERRNSDNRLVMELKRKGLLGPRW